MSHQLKKHIIAYLHWYRALCSGVQLFYCFLLFLLSWLCETHLANFSFIGFLFCLLPFTFHIYDIYKLMQFSPVFQVFHFHSFGLKSDTSPSSWETNMIIIYLDLRHVIYGIFFSKTNLLSEWKLHLEYSSWLIQKKGKSTTWPMHHTNYNQKIKSTVGQPL